MLVIKDFMACKDKIVGRSQNTKHEDSKIKTRMQNFVYFLKFKQELTETWQKTNCAKIAEAGYALFWTSMP